MIYPRLRMVTLKLKDGRSDRAFAYLLGVSLRELKCMESGIIPQDTSAILSLYEFSSYKGSFRDFVTFIKGVRVKGEKRIY